MINLNLAFNNKETENSGGMWVVALQLHAHTGIAHEGEFQFGDHSKKSGKYYTARSLHDK